MNTSTLYPPSTYRFSDRVIGHVLQRSRPQLLDEDGERRIDINSELLQTSRHRMTPSPFNAPGYPEVKRAKWSSGTPTQHKAGHTADLVLDEAAREKTDLEFRRQRNRQHQARYKKRQKERLVNLEASVVELQQGTHELETQHWILSR